MRRDLIDSTQWLSRTSVMGRIRSPQLKAIDEALKVYEKTGTEADLSRVRYAFAQWKAKEGAAWKVSKRNASGAITELDKKLDAPAPAPNFYASDLVHSRIGLLYLFSKMEVEHGWFKVAVESTFKLAGAGADFDPAKDAMGSAAGYVSGSIGAGSVISSEMFKMNPPPPRTPPPPGLFQSILADLQSFARRVWAHLMSKFESDPTKSWIDKIEAWWEPITKVINFVVSQVASSAAPFVGAAFDIAGGIKDTVTACYDRYQAYSLGKGVVLNDGHPAVIVQSIEKAMNFAIGKGLWDTLKGVTSLTLSAVAAGAGAVVQLVVAGCEVIIKVLHRLWELTKMESFFEDCRERYEKARVSQSIGVPDDSMVYSGVAFGAWLRHAAVALPCISALALCSGITGDKMMYLRMFQDEKELKTWDTDARSDEFRQRADQFNRGVIYIDMLKGWSRKYLEDSGYEFRSKDKFVQGIITATASGKIAPLENRQWITSPDKNYDLGSYRNPKGLISLADARAKFGGVRGQA